jgi:ribonuclease E
VVEGEEGYRAARSFMKLLMPSHVRRIQAYADPVPLFQRFGAEDQLNQMFQPVVQLRSGGYLVINPTEALVSIDINSGRSTREHGIEQTAVATNLEAAQEIARQLRLRDMAGLVVIDFIDMENNSNVRKVEKAMKAALANDRARIQVGRISSFGLMEMSRQRLRTGVLEASTRTCPHCEGSGFVRTASSAGLSALRLLEEEAARGRGSQLLLRASQEACFYLLNHKRAELAEIEERYGVRIEVLPSGELEGARMTVEASGPPPVHAPRFEPPQIAFDEDDAALDEADDEEAEEQEEREERAPRSEERAEGEGDAGRRRRRRRRRGKRRDQEGEAQATEPDSEAVDADDLVDQPDTAEAAEAAEGDDSERRRRGRRGRRGGRRRRGGEGQAESEQTLTAPEPVEAEAVVEAAPEPLDAPAVEEPAPKRRRTRKKAEEPVAAEPEAQVAGPEAQVAEPASVETGADTEAKPRRTRRKKADAEAPVEAAAPEVGAAAPEVEAKPKRTRRKKVDEAVAEVPAEAPAAAVPDMAEPAAEPANDQPAAPPRKGWWQRTIAGRL